MKKIILTAACFMALSPIAAHADEGKGLYGSLDVGLNAVGDVPVTFYDVDGSFGPANGSPDTGVGSYDLKSAAFVGGTIGYDFGNVRADIQIAYARNTVRSLSVATINGAPVTLSAPIVSDICSDLDAKNCTLSGTNTINFGEGPKLRQLSAMANIWYDIPTGGKIEPYVGGGLGVSGFEINEEGKGRFAWQIGAGVAYNISNSIAITVDFRHRQVAKFELPDTAVSGVRLGKIKTTTVGVGLRVNF